MKNVLQIIAVAQIAGGAYLGLLLMGLLYTFITSQYVTGIVMTVILAGPVSLMVFGGVYLLRADEKSIRLSIIAQAFQIPFISSPAIQYFMFSPVALYFQAGTNGSVGFDTGFFGNISFLLMTDVNGITVGINVVAAGVLIYLYRALNFLKSHDRLPRKLKCSTCNANFGWDTEFESREIKCDYCSEITTFENEREIN